LRIPNHVSELERVLLRANEHCVKRKTFDQSGRDDHRYLNDRGLVRLASDRLDRTFAQEPDAEPCSDHDEARAYRSRDVSTPLSSKGRYGHQHHETTDHQTKTNEIQHFAILLEVRLNYDSQKRKRNALALTDQTRLGP
jgi:hypothetical protein